MIKDETPSGFPGGNTSTTDTVSPTAQTYVYKRKTTKRYSKCIVTGQLFGTPLNMVFIIQTNFINSFDVLSEQNFGFYSTKIPSLDK
jgi:hypothetical protein